MIGLNRKISVENGLKLMGERNSGTNVLDTLLRQYDGLKLFDNIPILSGDMIHLAPEGYIPKGVAGKAAREALIDDMHYRHLPDTGGWKHAAPDDRFHRDFLTRHTPAIVMIIRHPASWHLSMYRNPFHRLVHIPKDHSAFLRQPWITVARDSLGPRVYPTLTDMYLAKVRAYSDLLETYANSTLIRYEDLIRDPAETLSRIGLTPDPSVTFSLPDDDARAFLPKPAPFWRRRKKPDYRTRAATAGYDLLPPDDREFLLDKLSDSPLLTLYPL